MTVSTINTLPLSLLEIIQEAFDVIGVGSEGETISADMFRRAKNSLNLMILSWNADENLWRKEQVTITPIADTAAYILNDPKPMRVTSARRKQLVGGYETPMTPWSRQEYLDMPSKTTSPSTPVNFYYDPQRDDGTLYLWPTPSSAVAPTISVIIDTLRPMFLMNAANDTLDFPQEWQQTVVYNLADVLMDKYPVNDPNVAGKITARAQILFGKLKAFDNEPVSIYLQPDDRWGDSRWC
ncbi:hypothetical protein [Sphingobium chungbukense]|uniref:Uncharacterized protein n=1 Tax=Sphingobium chungbukense TaxID=56193 RepID=A0A0M3AVT0_9SPHN|nr:hypothetical protein [Sphingobium chungbukense]KKW92684.1 hypothetical protein YP76_07050 [Sphingobium chungbukense]